MAVENVHVSTFPEFRNLMLSDKEVASLGKALIYQLAACTAVVVDEATSMNFRKYLEGKDERIFDEIRVAVVSGGSARFILLAVETTPSQRKKMNFPKYKMDARLQDYIEPVNACALNANVIAKSMLNEQQKIAAE